MSTDVYIVGNNAQDALERAAHVHDFVTATGKHAGTVVLAFEGIQTESVTVFFLNETVGADMAQNVAFGGTPELITDGGSGGTEWTGVINAGTWNLADSGKTTITSADNNDSVTFNDAGTIDMTGHTAITGLVDLDTYQPSAPNNNDIIIQFGLAGVPAGNSVSLNDFIDTGNFAEQAFVVPKADLGIGSATVDEMTITMIRGGGTKPIVKFDDIQIEETGTPLIFSVNVERGNRFHIDEIVFAYADAFAGTLVVDESTNTAAPKATMPAISYNKILGLSALTNGFVIKRAKAGKTLFSATIKTLGQQRAAGAVADEPWSDGTDTFVTLRTKFKRDLILTGDPNDTLTIQINDPMNGLTLFTASARGGLETP